MTLKGQIIGATLGLVIAVAAAIAFVVGDLASEQIRGRIGNSLSDLAAEMADRLDREMAVRVAEVEVLASLPALGDLDDRPRMRSVIEHLQTALPEFSWVGVLDTDGNVLVGTGAILEGVNIGHRPVFQNGKDGPFIGDVHDAVMLASLLDNSTGEPIKFVDIAQPILEKAGAPVGVLAAHLSWTWARSVEQSLLKGQGSRRNVGLYVVARDATVLLSPDGMLHGQSLALNSVDEAAKGRVGWAIETWADGNDYLTGYARADGYGPFKGFGWVVLARQPIGTAFQPIQDLTFRIAAIGLIFAALAAALGWWVASRIAGPVNELSRAADALIADQTAAFPKIRGPREIEVLSEAFEDLIETLISKQTALDEVTDKASKDPLTGLGNRAALERFLSTRQASSLAYAVLAVDLDRFKDVNDTHGHDAGDRVLREVAGRLRRCVRAGDVLVRSGGDEFLAFLVMMDPGRDGPARRVAARIVDTVGAPIDISEPGADEPVHISIGASVGVAFYPRHGAPVEQVVKLADGALYAAKRSGKGRVSVHQSAPSQRTVKA
ncbi:MAG: GGDEF domain-containing protein [Thalassobaculaceae bacterium]|nr:GGDEF domain-containing protein [Thalassobaculaceae bacterium]